MPMPPRFTRKQIDQIIKATEPPPHDDSIQLLGEWRCEIGIYTLTLSVLQPLPNTPKLFFLAFSGFTKGKFVTLSHWLSTSEASKLVRSVKNRENTAFGSLVSDPSVLLIGHFGGRTTITLTDVRRRSSMQVTLKEEKALALARTISSRLD